MNASRLRDKVTNLEQMLKESGENAKAQVSDLEYQLGRIISSFGLLNMRKFGREDCKFNNPLMTIWQHDFKSTTEAELGKLMYRDVCSSVEGVGS